MKPLPLRSFHSLAICRTVSLFAILTISIVNASGAEPLRILFFGDSLTAGYGVNPKQAYPALIEKKIQQARIHASVGVGATSGDTSAIGLKRISGMLDEPIDLFVLALGANDGLRKFDLNTTEKNLQTIIDRVRERYPKAQIVIAGMLLPPSFGVDYSKDFAEIFPRLATQNEAILIPFLLEGVGGQPELNLSDRMHPNPKGHRVIAKHVWETLEPLLQEHR